MILHYMLAINGALQKNAPNLIAQLILKNYYTFILYHIL